MILKYNSIAFQQVVNDVCSMFFDDFTLFLVVKFNAFPKVNIKCAICGDKLNARTVEFDHVRPLCASFGEQTFQWVHPHRHSSKTADEERPIDDDPLTRLVSVAGWSQFIESPLIPALTYCVNEIQDTQGALVLDVKRCRKRAWNTAPTSFPF